MKIIDDKGRIFGKINIIDLFVVILILTAVPVFYYGQKVLASKKAQIKVEEITVQIEVKFGALIPELANRIVEGDVQRDDAGNVLATIKNISEKKPEEGWVLKVQDDKFIPTPDYSLTRMRIVFSIKCNESNNTLYFNNYTIKIGNPFAFSTNLYNIQGVITDLKK